jgi:hypothetical protein
MQKVELKFLLNGFQVLPACECEARNPFVTGKQH